MVDTTWNRLNLMMQQGELGGNERSQLLLNSGLDAFQMDIACLTRIDDDQITVIFSTIKKWEQSQYHLHESLCQFTIEHRDLIASHNLEDTDWDGYGIIEDLRFGAYIGIPLTIENQIYGTLFFASHEPHARAFTTREEAFLKVIASSFRQIIIHHPVP